MTAGGSVAIGAAAVVGGGLIGAAADGSCDQMRDFGLGKLYLHEFAPIMETDSKALALWR